MSRCNVRFQTLLYTDAKPTRLEIGVAIVAMIIAMVVMPLIVINLI